MIILLVWTQKSFALAQALLCLTAFLSTLLFSFFVKRGPRVVMRIGSASLCLATIFFVLIWHFAIDEREAVKGILNIKTLPKSISNIECNSYGFTDILATCYFEIDSSEFSMLRNGRKFDNVDDSAVGTSFKEAGGPPVGKNFAIKLLYIEYSPGGHVKLMTDNDQNQVCIDIYIE